MRVPRVEGLMVIILGLTLLTESGIVHLGKVVTHAVRRPHAKFEKKPEPEKSMV